MSANKANVQVSANATVVRQMPQKHRVDIVRALRLLSIEGNRGLLEAIKAVKPETWVNDVKAALAQIDQDAIFRAHRARVVEQIWDGVTPINGVPAEEMKRLHQIGDSDGAYTIAVDGRIIVFQPVHGVKDAAELARRAQEHADQIAAAYVHQDIEGALVRMLLG